jgi:hypothetical protein
MKTLLMKVAVLLVALSGTATADGRPAKPASPPAAPNTTTSKSSVGGNGWLVGDIKLGYHGGVGLHVSVTALNFAQNFPFSVRLGLGYTRVDAGDDWGARRVFINDNTNGTARSNAHVWDGRLDLLYPVKLLDLQRTTLFGGVRRSDFNAYFEYIGGAETFDVMTTQWGLGGGIETAFAVSPRVDMVLTLGGDYYFRSELSGHDTYYRPDGNDTHPIDDYTFTEADAVINQPDVMTRLMLGVAYHF